MRTVYLKVELSEGTVEQKQLLYSKYIKMCISRARAICTKRNRVVFKNSRMFSSSFVGLVHVSNGLQGTTFLCLKTTKDTQIRKSTFNYVSKHGETRNTLVLVKGLSGIPFSKWEARERLERVDLVSFSGINLGFLALFSLAFSS